ncbi:response regulator transcription factor [Oerskovia sp. M15]
MDDNPVVRMGLRAIVEASDVLTFAGEAGDGDAAIAMVHGCRPDVTLLDVRMPRRDGIEVLVAIRDVTSVLMLTYSDGPDVVRAALTEGLSGTSCTGTSRRPASSGRSSWWATAPSRLGTCRGRDAVDARGVTDPAGQPAGLRALRP